MTFPKEMTPEEASPINGTPETIPITIQKDATPTTSPVTIPQEITPIMVSQDESLQEKDVQKASPMTIPKETTPEMASPINGTSVTSSITITKETTPTTSRPVTIPQEITLVLPEEPLKEQNAQKASLITFPKETIPDEATTIPMTIQKEATPTTSQTTTPKTASEESLPSDAATPLKTSNQATPSPKISPSVSPDSSSQIVIHQPTQAVTSQEISSGLVNDPNDVSLSNNTSFELNMSSVSTHEITSPSPKAKLELNKVSNHHTSTEGSNFHNKISFFALHNCASTN